MNEGRHKIYRALQQTPILYWGLPLWYWAIAGYYTMLTITSFWFLSIIVVVVATVLVRLLLRHDRNIFSILFSCLVHSKTRVWVPHPYRIPRVKVYHGQNV